MKKLILFIYFVLSLSLSYCQTVSIPDANFLSALIQKGVDTNNDGVIQVSEAEAVDSLNVTFKQISSLEGINSFVNLEKLYCHQNPISLLNLNLPLLRYLDISYNNIDSFNLVLPNLKYLDIEFNSFKELDVNSFPLLEHLN